MTPSSKGKKKKAGSGSLPSKIKKEKRWGPPWPFLRGDRGFRLIRHCTSKGGKIKSIGLSAAGDTD